MLDPQASRFGQAAVLSGLMDVESLMACWNAIPPGKREDPEHIDRRLARQAVQSQALTLWQAQQLLAGRTSGFKVDRYVLLELIGQGGMGRVYLARDTRLNRRVALKILAPGADQQPAGGRAVPARGAGRRPVAAREPRAGLRLRRVQRPLLPRDGVHRGQDDRPPALRAGADAAGDGGAGWSGRWPWGWAMPTARG